jgi:hypothetical protein
MSNYFFVRNIESILLLVKIKNITEVASYSFDCYNKKYGMAVRLYKTYEGFKNLTGVLTFNNVCRYCKHIPIFRFVHLTRKKGFFFCLLKKVCYGSTASLSLSTAQYNKVSCYFWKTIKDEMNSN